MLSVRSLAGLGLRLSRGFNIVVLSAILKLWVRICLDSRMVLVVHCRGAILSALSLPASETRRGVIEVEAVDKSDKSFTSLSSRARNQVIISPFVVRRWSVSLLVVLKVVLR